jgi:hypothetical protein
LEIKCPSKAHVLKAWLLAIGGGGMFRRWGLLGGSWVTGSVPSKRMLGSLLLSLLLTDGHEVNGPPGFSTMMHCASIGPRQEGHATEASKTISQNKPLSFYIDDLRCFVTATES